MGVLIDPAMVQKVGTNAAALYAQLRYWRYRSAGGRNRYVVKRGGKVFVAHSHKALMEETGLTINKLKGAISKLVREGYLTSEKHLFDNVIMAHFWFTDDPLETAPEAENQPTDKGEKHPTDKLVFNSSYKKNEDCLEIKKDLAPPSASLTGSNPPPALSGEPGEVDNDAEYGTVSGIKEEAAPICEEGDMKKDGYSVADIAAGLKTHTEKAVDPKKASKVGDYVSIYRRAWAETYPDFWLEPFIAKHLGQLKQIGLKLPSGKAGVIIDYAVRNWDHVKQVAKTYYGAYSVPSIPNLNFMMVHIGALVRAWQEGQEEVQAAQPKFTQKPTSKPKPDPVPVPVKPEDEVASLEDIEKIIFGDDADA